VVHVRAEALLKVMSDAQVAEEQEDDEYRVCKRNALMQKNRQLTTDDFFVPRGTTRFHRQFIQCLFEIRQWLQFLCSQTFSTRANPCRL